MFVGVPDTFKEAHLYDGSEGTFAGFVLEMLREIGFQEIVNEGGYEDLLRSGASMENSVLVSLAPAKLARFSPSVRSMSV